MEGFPQPVDVAAGSKRPVRFACVFASIPSRLEAFQTPTSSAWSPSGIQEGRSVLSMAMGWSPAARAGASGILWPEWSLGMEMCQWKGGELDAHALSDFAVFGKGAGAFFKKAFGMDPSLEEAAAWMGQCFFDYFTRHDPDFEPPDSFAEVTSMAWISRGSMGPGFFFQCVEAKRLVLAAWEAAEIGAATGSASSKVGQCRL